MRIEDAQLSRLLPRFMREDRVARALSSALKPTMGRLAASIRDMELYTNTMLPEPVLDELAWQRNVLWYDPAADLEIKRALIRSAIDICRAMGTKRAIERAITDYFGDAQVEEWFEYEGEPYHFRIYTTNPDAVIQNGAKLRWIVDIVKRASAVLDGIYVISSGTAPVFVGGLFQVYEHISLRQA